MENLLRQMDQVFFPLPELQHLLLFSISAVITLFGTQHVLSMNQWLLQFSLESLFFFFCLDWSQISLLKDVRTSKALVKEIPSQLMLTCLEPDPAFMVNPKFLAHPEDETNKQHAHIVP